MEEDWSAYADVYPVDEMPHFGIRIVSSIDPNGIPHIHWHYEGENVQALWMVGTMISAAFEILHEKIHENS